MKEKLNSIILEEMELILKLLSLLEEQHLYVVKNDIYAMENIVGELEACSKEIARTEVKRKETTNGASMREIVSELKDKELEDNYRKIRKLLEEARLQRETNEILIRQGLGFNTRMLQLLNPDRSRKTYNNYGKMGKR